VVCFVFVLKLAGGAWKAFWWAARDSHSPVSNCSCGSYVFTNLKYPQKCRIRECRGEHCLDWLLVRGSHEGPLFTNLDRRTKRARLAGAGLYKIVRCLGEDVGITTRPHGIRHAAIR
jgi:hypothetical protein